MNIIQAAEDSYQKILEFEDEEWPFEPAANNRFHTAYLLNSIINGQVAGEKAQRWLGWAQSSMCMAGVATIEELKEINKKSL